MRIIGTMYGRVRRAFLGAACKLFGRGELRQGTPRAQPKSRGPEQAVPSRKECYLSCQLYVDSCTSFRRLFIANGVASGRSVPATAETLGSIRGLRGERRALRPRAACAANRRAECLARRARSESACVVRAQRHPAESAQSGPAAARSFHSAPKTPLQAPAVHPAA